MADGRHFEKVQCHISAAVRLILMKFGRTMHISPPNPMGKQKFKKCENPRWRTATILKILKSQYLINRLADLDEILQDHTY